MGSIFKKYLFRRGVNMNTIYITLSTTSTSGRWSPQSVINSGDVLTWDISGDITPTSQVINDPTFDLSSNIGTVDMVAYGVNGIITEFICSLNQLTLLNISNNPQLIHLECNNNSLTTLDVSNNTQLVILNCFENQLTTLDISSNTQLTQLLCNDNSLTTLDISSNTQLITLQCQTNSLTTLDVSNNTQLTTLYCYENGMSSASVDQIFIDLAVNGQTNGNLYIGNNRTSASDTARTTLLGRGWNINDSYTP